MTDGVTPGREITPAQRRQRQMAALRHGLRAKAAPRLRTRNKRVGALLLELQRHVTLRPVDLPLARRWAELECMAVDHSAILVAPAASVEDGREKLVVQYLAIVRAQTALAGQLGITPAARLAFERESGNIMTSRSHLAQIAAARPQNVIQAAEGHEEPPNDGR